MAQRLDQAPTELWIIERRTPKGRWSWAGWIAPFSDLVDVGGERIVTKTLRNCRESYPRELWRAVPYQRTAAKAKR